jgi:CRISPR-associated endonuclease/helicase Cas3
MAEIDFGIFYETVHGYPPFPWQKRLAELAVAGEWPRSIAIPTGCGKTSVIDIAVFALAMQAGTSCRSAALRIFFVVDRRLVVDDVHKHAMKLARAIEGNEALHPIKARLQKYGGPTPLAVAVLRGGMYRNDTWADAPNQPLVCVATVDQAGSRLLFRGYGVTERQRPVHAGLMGNDSLLIVDEAHLSQPFLDTLEWIQRYQTDAWRQTTPAPALQAIRMSATVTGEFAIDDDDLESEALRDRLNASKLAELKETAGLPKAAAEEAVQLSKSGADIVGVILNTVADARSCFNLLGGEKILLTGRMRPFDRDALLEKYARRIRAGREPSDGAKLFVVATQTIEVGADLDFDALVTEAAPMDSLRQRFGRLDRLGRRQTSRAVILKPKKTVDWVYGEATERAWKWLLAQNSPVDFGIQTLPNWPADASTMKAAGPIIFPVHVDTWAQTSPTPSADPDIAPFLHGPDSLESADVQIVWRADLDADDPGAWLENVEAAPPTSMEALPISLRAARKWLSGEAAPVSDVEGGGIPPEGEYGGEARGFLIWRGPDEHVNPSVRSLRPGDTIIVRSSEGGCDQFGWDPRSRTAVTDIGDACANLRADGGGGRYRMRVHPRVVFPLEQHKEQRELLSRLLNELEEGEDDAIGEIRRLLPPTTVKFDWRRIRSYGAGNALLVEAPRLRVANVSNPDDADEKDSLSLTRPISLQRHTEGVVQKARLFLRCCGVTGPAAVAVEVAAERHDLGKWDERFQILLGNWDREPWAKGDACSPAVSRRRRAEAEYPKGARHEFASAAIAEIRGEWPEGCDAELAQYLIGTHHGYGRPLPPVWIDEKEIAAVVGGRKVVVSRVSDVSRIDSGWADLYWRMTRRYGWWGLAYLEAILRRADCVRSREEETADEQV